MLSGISFIRSTYQKLFLQISPAEIQNDHAMVSIENVFAYSDRYGHSNLKSD